MPGYANPQNLNRYSYVGNSPLNYTDPSGHMRLRDGPTQDRYKPYVDKKYVAKPDPRQEKARNDAARGRSTNYNSSTPTVTTTPTLTYTPTATATPTLTYTSTVTPACMSPSRNCATALSAQSTVVAFQSPTATMMPTPYITSTPFGADFVNDFFDYCTGRGATCGQESGLGPGAQAFDVAVNGGHFVGDLVEMANNQPPMTQEQAQAGLGATLLTFFFFVLPWVLL